MSAKPKPQTDKQLLAKAVKALKLCYIPLSVMAVAGQPGMSKQMARSVNKAYEACVDVLKPGANE